MFRRHDISELQAFGAVALLLLFQIGFCCLLSTLCGMRYVINAEIGREN